MPVPFIKNLFLKIMCLCKSVQCAGRPAEGSAFPKSWNYWHLYAPGCGCWELNSKKQRALLNRRDVSPVPKYTRSPLRMFGGTRHGIQDFASTIELYSHSSLSFG